MIIGCRHAEDLIVTPFAQILHSLRSVRNNYVLLTNVTSTRLVWRRPVASAGAAGAPAPAPKVAAPAPNLKKKNYNRFKVRFGVGRRHRGPLSPRNQQQCIIGSKTREKGESDGKGEPVSILTGKGEKR